MDRRDVTKQNEAWPRRPLISYLTAKIDLRFLIYPLGIPALLLIFKTLWMEILGKVV